tara:strand:- start:1023 stop:1307 length:285 start_codon:yes stop_codon:yes gene_type:complete
MKACITRDEQVDAKATTFASMDCSGFRGLVTAAYLPDMVVNSGTTDTELAKRSDLRKVFSTATAIKLVENHTREADPSLKISRCLIQSSSGHDV